MMTYEEKIDEIAACIHAATTRYLDVRYGVPGLSWPDIIGTDGEEAFRDSARLALGTIVKRREGRTIVSDDAVRFSEILNAWTTDRGVLLEESVWIADLPAPENK